MDYEAVIMFVVGEYDKWLAKKYARMERMGLVYTDMRVANCVESACELRVQAETVEESSISLSSVISTKRGS